MQVHPSTMMLCCVQPCVLCHAVCADLCCACCVCVLTCAVCDDPCWPMLCVCVRCALTRAMHADPCCVCVCVLCVLCVLTRAVRAVHRSVSAKSVSVWSARKWQPPPLLGAIWAGLSPQSLTSYSSQASSMTQCLKR